MSLPHPKDQSSVRAKGRKLVSLVGRLVFMHPILVQGDILRAPAPTAPGSSSNAGSAVTGALPTQLQPARANANDVLARTTNALNAVRAMQEAARVAAETAGTNHLGLHPTTGQPLPSVANGLAPGGLQIDSRVAQDAQWWKGADLPTQATVNGKTEVTIKQNAQQALLHWNTFNIGRDTILRFDQTASGASSQSIAFNRVLDPSGNPTQILGQISAPGQVFIINTNGIVFGATSKVNVHTLTASSLPINENLIAQGLVNNPDQQFLFSSLSIPQGINGTPGFTPDLPANARIGDVTVQAGAQIRTPVTADGNGGRIFLAGANVNNAGTLSSANGQVILAAGLQVGIAPHSSSDPSLRGLDVYVGAIADPASLLTPYAGQVTHTGIIDIPRANATLVGAKIRHAGIIDSSTSVALNGRIDLKAHYDAVSNAGFDAANPNSGLPFVNRQSGQVVMGTDSVTRILPEIASTAKTIGTELALKSQINIEGKTIHHATGSIVLAPSADLAIKAGSWSFLPSASLPLSFFLPSAGQVYLDQGSLIHLAGTVDARASVTQNLLRLVLRGSELAPAPLQREGELRGQEIVVDANIRGVYEGREWIGTPLADLVGYLGLIERNVAQLTTAGGNLTISAGQSAVIRQGSIIDLSGGWTNFEGGTVETTRVVSNGQIVDIAEATPDQVFSGVYTGVSNITSQRWGVVRGFTRALAPAGIRFQQSYTQGANAGRIEVSAPSIVLDGQVKGQSFAGENQVRNNLLSSSLPKAGSMILNFRGQQSTSPNFFITYPDSVDVVFEPNDDVPDVADFSLDENGNPTPIAESRRNLVQIDADVLQSRGMGSLTIHNELGRIIIPESTNITMGPGGALSLSASIIDVAGNVHAPGGQLSFRALNVSPFLTAVLLGQQVPELPTLQPGRGIFRLGANARLDVSGSITDDRTSSSGSTPVTIQGGSVSIQALSLNLEEKSVIDVSGGYALSPQGVGVFGDGGTITLKAGQDPLVSSITGGGLSLKGNLLGYSGKRGGTLSLQAPFLRIGGSTADADAFWIAPEFFSEGGFQRFLLRGLGNDQRDAITIKENTIIRPVQKILGAVAKAPGEGVTVGAFEELFGRAPVEGERQPVSIHLSAPGVTDTLTGGLLSVGRIVMEANSLIQLESRGSFSAVANAVSIQGSIITPAGDIKISGASNSSSIFGDFARPLTTTHLGRNSVLSARGSVVLTPDPFGRRIGTVYSGGSITVEGNIVAESGALIDVSGTSGVLDIDPALANVFQPNLALNDNGVVSVPRVEQFVPVTVESNGGAIVLRGGQSLITDATLQAHAGGATALGGTLSVSSNRFYSLAEIESPADITLTIGQRGPTLTQPLLGNPLGQFVSSHLGSGQGFFQIDSFANGGFDSLSLGGVLQVREDVAIRARGEVKLADRGLLFGESALSIEAGAVSIGLPFQRPALPEEEVSPILFNNLPLIIPAKHGLGTMEIVANTIDVGGLSLQGTGSASLTAQNGDIRGNGTMIIAGDLKLKAAQIYPTTASEFQLIAYDYQNAQGAQKGSISIEQSGSRRLPLSAGGSLNVFASSIHHQGVLRAPFGSIRLGYDGTGDLPRDWFTGNARPFPVTTSLVLANGSITSVSGVDPQTGKGLVLPYGFSPNGNQWIDPRGVDITASGPPQKTVSLFGANITQEAGSTIDLRGGGDLYATRFVPGLGGPTDILDSTQRFAVIPGYDANIAPFAAFNDSQNVNNLIKGAPGYLNGQLNVGDRIYLSASKDLPAGYYTLLPARYALLPGALMVQANQQNSVGTVQTPDGAAIVTGVRYNALNQQRAFPSVGTRFEVVPAAVVRARAQYQDFSANAFLQQSATDLNASIPLLPKDSGSLRISSSQSMDLRGTVLSPSISGGRGAEIDISSQLNLRISNQWSQASDAIQLNAQVLREFNAASLLIGGTRKRTESGVAVQVNSGSVIVDNEGVELVAEDIILAAKNQVTVSANSVIRSTSTTTASADKIVISGDGALLRVAADAQAELVRSNVTASTVPLLSIGSGARIQGGATIFDSTSRLSLDPTASLLSTASTFGAGKINILFDDTLTAPSNGLVLTNRTLRDLQSASSINLSSYSTIDLYGSGSFGSSQLTSLRLSASTIQGFQQNAGVTQITAREIVLQNPNQIAVAQPTQATNGTLRLVADRIRLGVNQTAAQHYAQVELQASRGILGESNGGFSVQSDLNVQTPRISGTAGSVRSITAGGNLVVTNASSTSNLVSSGLGASLRLIGSSIQMQSEIQLPSGSLSLESVGDITVGGSIDVAGTERNFGGARRYTSAGQVGLASQTGNIVIASTAKMDLSAKAAGGDAGALTLSAPQGRIELAGQLMGQAGRNGRNGSVAFDVSTLPTISAFAEKLSNSAFTQRQSFRVRQGDVTIDGNVQAREFRLYADQGSIEVSGRIAANGTEGGTIHLSAHRNLSLLDGAELDASAQKFSNAGKGGQVTLEAGSQRLGVVGSGVLDIQAGSLINLQVAEADLQSASRGKFTGQLHLRAPRINQDVAIQAISGQILGASSIIAEAYRLYDLTASGGTMTTAVQNQIRSDAEGFLGTSGNASAGYSTMMNRLLSSQPLWASSLVLAPGAEIINRNGNLTLGTPTSTAAADWNLGNFRVGPNQAPGVLTLRASGNLVFHNALSDGFVSSAYTAPLLSRNLLLPANVQSWSYRLVAGADLSAAHFGQTLALPSLAAGNGSLLLGKNNGSNFSNSNGSNNTPGNNATTALALNNRFQVIRTGTGDISIHTGRSVQLLNQFATIYTAGTQVLDPTMGGRFDLPILDQSGGNVTLGAIQQNPTYPVQYTMAGGNVSLTAGQDIERITRNNQNQVIADSQRQLPNNWLYRRGFVDPLTGEFGTSRFGDVASTTWWVDFSNFFQGVGALGGGNVRMVAANNINNVDAVIPTNARMERGTPNASQMLELGGGDLLVRAGNDLDAGVYYVERGKGEISAGGNIITNATRSPSVTQLTGASNILDANTWLPTTLFVGKGGFDVTASGNLLLGPTANVFLLPVGINNTFWQKSYFSTYAADSYVNALSLGGNLTLRQSATLPVSGAGNTTSLLAAWIDRQQILRTNPVTSSFYQPWLRLAETSAEPFRTTVSLLPPTLSATALAGSVSLVGQMNLTPSSTGNVEILAANSIDGLQPNGRVTFNGTSTSWGAARINLSDANPAAIPGITSPFGYKTLVGNDLTQARSTRSGFLSFINRLFQETGATSGPFAALENKQTLHTPGILHRDDPNPLRLFAGTGDISGLTLFSSKFALIHAGRDLSDIAFYLQNARPSDATSVTAGRDIILSNANSPLRIAANRSGNVVNIDSIPLAGDIQISGNGTLQVLAGRNLDLGIGLDFTDGTGTGVTSIGNTRNPYLPSAGANLVLGAGIAQAFTLANSSLNWSGFIDQFVNTESGAKYLEKLAPGVNFSTLSEEEQSRLALGVFSLILRDAGRNFPTAQNYDIAERAIKLLMGENPAAGNIFTRARNIRTTAGGEIQLAMPGGGLTLADTVIGSPASPPGIITEFGGNISIFAQNNIDIGIGRIFTLRGGNQIIWSSKGDIAAGSSSKTITSAPPTRVLIDSQSAAVQTDLAGLATGGGIGALAAVAGVPLGDVDLIAPNGTVDAGDAGIRVSGNLNIAAQQVLNAGNISVGGNSVGTPTVPSAPSISAVTAANNANVNTTQSDATNRQDQESSEQELAQGISLIDVEVLGYGGGEEEDDEENKEDSF